MRRGTVPARLGGVPSPPPLCGVARPVLRTAPANPSRPDASAPPTVASADGLPGLRSDSGQDLAWMHCGRFAHHHPSSAASGPLCRSASLRPLPPAWGCSRVSRRNLRGASSAANPRPRQNDAHRLAVDRRRVSWLGVVQRPLVHWLVTPPRRPAGCKAERSPLTARRCPPPRQGAQARAATGTDRAVRLRRGLRLRGACSRDAGPWSTGRVLRRHAPRPSQRRGNTAR